VNVFFDTNVLLDVLAERRPFYEDSVRAWSLAETGKVRGLVSAITCANLFYILRKSGGQVAARRGLRLARSVFSVVPCDEAIVDQAIEADVPDFEDAIQLHSAARCGAEYIVTRNLGHFAKSGIPVLSPRDFLTVYLRR
jgi:predicted nucleic acid-binding protein